MPHPLGIQTFRMIATQYGGKCLSTEYKNQRQKLSFRCAKGHEWETSAGSVKAGHWCPHCAGQGKPSISDMKALAKKRHGKCLSNEYLNNRTKLLWECAEGHQWKAAPGHIKTGTWCPYCAGRGPVHINDLRKIAKERGGELLSEKYVNTETKLLWRCEKKHEWEAKPAKIKIGQWCPVCKWEKIRKAHAHDYDFVAALATERGGRLVSKSYKNNQTNVEWECAYRHRWKQKAAHIIAGHWCPICMDGFGERLARAAFEALFEKPFPSTWPSWLIGPKNQPLEIDGFNEELRLGFEHQGPQHYQSGSIFVPTEKSLKTRIHYDELKRQTCQEKGVTLVEVPWIPKELHPNEVMDFVRTECLRLGITLPKEADIARLDISSVYATNVAAERLEELKNIAKGKGGLCLAEHYLYAKEKVSWRCAQGHEWNATADSVKRGSWCPICARKIAAKKRLGTIEKMQALAIERGGECLSKVYVNSRTPLKWKCSKGHEWEASPANVKHTTWCPVCARSKITGRPKKIT